MSSNIKIKRICKNCGKEFIASTTVTRFCGTKCNSQYYKSKAREEKIGKSEIQTLAIKTELNNAYLSKEVLTVKDIAIVLGSSRVAVYDMIKSGRLKAVNLSQRKTRVLNSDFKDMFIQIEPIVTIRASKEAKNKSEEDLSIVDCYSMFELISMFNKNRTALYTAFCRAGIICSRHFLNLMRHTNLRKFFLKKNVLMRPNWHFQDFSMQCPFPSGPMQYLFLMSFFISKK